MGIILITVMMLVASNIFMTFAWYGHLKDLKDRCASSSHSSWST